MGYVTNDLVMLLVLVAFNSLIYKKDKLIGGILYFVIAISTLVISDVDRVFAFAFFGLTLVNLIWDILSRFLK